MYVDFESLPVFVSDPLQGLQIAERSTREADPRNRMGHQVGEKELFGTKGHGPFFMCLAKISHPCTHFFTLESDFKFF